MGWRRRRFANPHRRWYRRRHRHSWITPPTGVPPGPPDGSDDPQPNIEGPSPSGTVGFMGAATNVWEAAGPVTVVVQRRNGSAGRIAVDLSVIGGTGVENTDYDYAGTSGQPISLQWPANNLADIFTFVMTPIRRADSTVPATVVLGLSLPATPPPGYNAVPPTIDPDRDEFIVSIIREGNGIVVFSGSTWEVEEPPAGPDVNLAVTISRQQGAKGAVGVSYNTVNGTAIAGTDYVATSGSFSWTDGEGGVRTILVPIKPRAGPQGDRSFTIILHTPTGGLALGSPSTATVTIKEAPVPPNPFPAPTVPRWVDDFLGIRVNNYLDEFIVGYGTELILSDYFGQQIGNVIGYGGVSEFTNEDWTLGQSPPLRFQVHEV